MNVGFLYVPISLMGQMHTIITPPWNREHRGLYFHFSLSVCVPVSVSACKQNSSQTNAPIWTRFSLNGCFPHWLGFYWNWWPWDKGQGHSESISIFLHNYLLTSLLFISALIYLIKLKFSMPLRYAICRSVVELHKNQLGDDVMVTSFKFSPNNCPYLKFY